MISKQARLKQLAKEQAASLRILKRMAAVMQKPIKAQSMTMVCADQVSEILGVCELMSMSIDNLCHLASGMPTDDEDMINAVLGSAEGERLARDYLSASVRMQMLIKEWEHKSLTVLPMERLAEDQHPPSSASAQLQRVYWRAVFADRTAAHQYTALLRQAEALQATLRARLDLQHLRFWLMGETLQFTGQRKTKGGEHE